MVQPKETPHYRATGQINLEAWITHITQNRPPADRQMLRHACTLSQLVNNEHIHPECGGCLEQGIAMAEILNDLNMDTETLIAALILEGVQYSEMTLDDVTEHFGLNIAKLVSGVDRMRMIDALLQTEKSLDKNRIDHLRKMFLSMVDDVRVVFIKLAERTHRLRKAASLSEVYRQKLAHEIQDIYAPLANRLGIGELKWELEDLAFRYLQPETYKEIAQLVAGRRIDRDRYIQDVIAELKHLIERANIKNAQIQGRAKHIFSIYKKMTRKKIGFDQIFDASAVRILVEHIEDCYAALSIVHANWPHISEEFDDYIATPKPNGYRSIHTAVIGPQDKPLEVQIRTFDMHEESEMGFAAHWKYKEGEQKAGYENKIALLRQVIAWQKDLSAQSTPVSEIPADIFKDRIYVFTPEGDIVDLMQSATPLDFAYHIHSEIGHRCRGAKVNGHIVPLTYTLQTGDRIEILKAKHPKPSRDWLNSELGYLKTSRAKSKVHHWFRQADYEQHLTQGRELIKRELQQLGLPTPDFDPMATKMNYKTADDLIAAVGSGDVKPSQIIHLIPTQTMKEEVYPTILPAKTTTNATNNIVSIQGIDNLLTHIARCCKPIPGDPIIGYITTGRGVTIHHHHCSNIHSMRENSPARFMEVNWTGESKQIYPVDLHLIADDRAGLLRDITLTLSHEHVDILGLQTFPNSSENQLTITLTLRLSSLNELNSILQHLRQIRSVVEARRSMKH